MGFVCQEHVFRSLGTPWHMGFPLMGFLVGFAGNILNFNVGAGVDLSIPRSFWSRLAGKYGNLFYWQEKVMQESFFCSKKFHHPFLLPSLEQQIMKKFDT
jgi:hypothetical protein